MTETSGRFLYAAAPGYGLWSAADSMARASRSMSSRRSGRLAGSSQRLRSSSGSSRRAMSSPQGWRLSASRMGELLLVNILREHLLRAIGATEAGWWRGLSDPAIARAIAAMHREPARGWSVEALACEAAMSRSRFSERFKTLVGDAPMGYLGGHRMALVAEQLEAGHQPLAKVAQDAGYESDKVFARAFRRWSGLSPTAYAKREVARRAAMGNPHAASAAD